MARSHFVIATAGHVDHGKSTLVRALSGIDPDRLAEEKARAMTIDLGYAWFNLPGGALVSIVDVPGHERFIKNMLAGVGGIDGALVVIAADDGVMPQTTEHLAILDLLQIEPIVIALTRVDLVDDVWLDLVQEDIREQLSETRYAGAPLVPVSSRTGTGLAELAITLEQELLPLPAPVDLQRPRLSLDRVFTMPGYGTVVTGTLIDGVIRTNDELLVYPRQLPVRVRGLQIRNRSVECAEPGERVALNLVGVSPDDLRRGDLLAPVKAFEPGTRFDVWLTLLPDAPTPLRQNDRVDLFLAASEAAASLTLLDRDRLEPGESGWVQLRFATPIVAAAGDRFIIRRASPSRTIGGGSIIVANAARHRRFDHAVLTQLDAHRKGSPEIRLLAAIGSGFLPVTPDLDLELVARLANEGKIRQLGRSPRFLVTASRLSALTTAVRSTVEQFHREHPAAAGIPRQTLRERIMAGSGFSELIEFLVGEGIVIDESATIRTPGFSVRLAPELQPIADQWLAEVDSAPFTPPAPPPEMGQDALRVLITLGRIIPAEERIFLTPAALNRIEQLVLETIDREKRIDLARYRDLTQSSRKYAQAVLELLDRRRITRRVGDYRIRYRPAVATAAGEAS